MELLAIAGLAAGAFIVGRGAAHPAAVENLEQATLGMTVADDSMRAKLAAANVVNNAPAGIGEHRGLLNNMPHTAERLAPAADTGANNRPWMSRQDELRALAVTTSSTRRDFLNARGELQQHTLPLMPYERQTPLEAIVSQPSDAGAQFEPRLRRRPENDVKLPERFHAVHYGPPAQPAAPIYTRHRRVDDTPTNSRGTMSGNTGSAALLLPAVVESKDRTVERKGRGVMISPAWSSGNNNPNAGAHVGMRGIKHYNEVVEYAPTLRPLSTAQVGMPIGASDMVRNSESAQRKTAGLPLDAHNNNVAPAGVVASMQRTIQSGLTPRDRHDASMVNTRRPNIDLGSRTVANIAPMHAGRENRKFGSEMRAPVPLRRQTTEMFVRGADSNFGVSEFN